MLVPRKGSNTRRFLNITARGAFAHVGLTKYVAGTFLSARDRARQNKGGMADLRYYQTQPHETWKCK